MQYHPDKTDNELFKAKFADIKEAYEILSHPMKRREYDLRFDNFSYKKEAYLTPYQILEKAKKLRINTEKGDPYRLDRDRLEFEITEVLSEKNIETLARTDDRAVVQYFILEMTEAAKPLSPKQYQQIYRQLFSLADDATKEKLISNAANHSCGKRWDSYKLYVAIVVGILLCVLIYLSSVS